MSRAKARYSYVGIPEEPVLPKVTAQPAVLAIPAQKEKKGTRGTGASPLGSAKASATDALINPAAYALPAQRRGKRNEEGVLKRTDVPREQLNVRIRPELKRAAAGMAGLTGMTLGDVVEAALIEYLNHRKDT